MPERRICAMFFQTLIGHSFVGSYYQRFNIPEPVSCPCGHTLQTISCVLHFCPHFAHKHPPHFSHPNFSFHNLLLHPEKYHLLYTLLSDNKALAKFVQLDPQPPKSVYRCFNLKFTTFIAPFPTLLKCLPSDLHSLLFLHVLPTVLSLHGPGEVTQVKYFPFFNK